MYKLNWTLCLTTTSFYRYVLYAVERMCFVLLCFSVKHTATLYGLFLTHQAALFWEQDYLVALPFVRCM